MEKKQHIDLNNINDHILLFGGNDDNTDKYGISTNEDRIFKNVSNSDDINLSSGLYIYYDPIYNPQKITFFMYDEKAVGEIENKFVYEIPNNTTIGNKEDILTVIMDNIDKVFPKQNNDNNQQIIKENFFQLFILCLRPGYKINHSCFQDDSSKQQFISDQLSNVKYKIQTLCSEYLKKNLENNISGNRNQNNTTVDKTDTQKQSFLLQCQKIIEEQYQQQYKRFKEYNDMINNNEANIGLCDDMKCTYI